MGSQTIDILRVLLAAFLVFLMQPGFMCLESGLTRSKNAINVAIKNITDFGISVSLYWAFGFAVMFGATQGGWFGTSGFFLDVGEGEMRFAVFFVFQAMFCGTATTILSGAVAERMRFRGYVVVAILLSSLIYPFYGHWSWYGIFDTNGPAGWLRAMGFRDFAGSSVVHSVGGWVALAAVLVIGPRQGRFPAGKSPCPIPGQSLPMAVLGTLLLWMGWFGFNGGSTFAMGEDVARVIVNTMLAGVAGLMTGLVLSQLIHGRPVVLSVMNGALAGLVAITANCNVVTTPSAIMIGMVGAAIMSGLSLLLQRLHIDDVVDAIPVHAGAGIWGIIAVALFGQPDRLRTGLSWSQQLGVQLLAVGVCFVWAFGVSYLLLQLLNRIIPLRVPPEDELSGLNVTEHGATTEILDLLTVMDQQAKTGDLSQRVKVEPFTEVGQIAALYNRVMDALETADTQQQVYANELKRSNSDLERFAYAASHDLNQPLRGIKGFSQILAEQTSGKLDSEANESLKMIVDCTNHMQTLISDLFEFSCVSTKGNEFKSVDCAEVVEHVLHLLRMQITDTGAKLHFENLPTISADVRQLRQLLQNLIGNALKYHGDEQPEISISAQRRDELWQFSVRDNGIGIPDKFRERVFQIFQRLHGGDKYEGTGIGLALCRRIVERHGGTIWIESAPVQGTVFCFTIPNRDTSA